MKFLRRAFFMFLAFSFLFACGTATTTTVEKGAKEKMQAVSKEEEAPGKGAKVRALKKRVAVVDFEMKSKLGKLQLASDATDILITELVASGKFTVFERSKLNSILQEQKLQVSDLTNPQTAVRVGQLLGVNAIITGAVTNFGTKLKGGSFLGLAQSKSQVAEAEVDIRIVDVETGKILFADRGVGTAETSSGSFLGVGSAQTYDVALAGKALRAAISNLVDRIVRKFAELPWTATIAKVTKEPQTGKIYAFLNAGENEGLQKGDVLFIYERGEPIQDPVTNEIIGYEEKLVGKAKVVSFYGDNKYAKVRIIEGKAQNGYTVKLQAEEAEGQGEEEE